MMSEVPLDPLSPLPLQTLATITLNPPSIAVDRCLLRRLAMPVARATVGLGYISSHFHLSKTKRNLVAVIALVRHHFLDSVRMHFILAFRRLFGDHASIVGTTAVPHATPVRQSTRRRGQPTA